MTPSIRPKRSSAAAEHRLHLLEIGHVRSRQEDLGAELLEPLHFSDAPAHAVSLASHLEPGGPVLSLRKGTAADQRETRPHLAGKPFGQGQAYSAQPSRDDVGAAVAQTRRNPGPSLELLRRERLDPTIEAAVGDHPLVLATGTLGEEAVEGFHTPFATPRKAYVDRPAVHTGHLLGDDATGTEDGGLLRMRQAFVAHLLHAVRHYRQAHRLACRLARERASEGEQAVEPALLRERDRLARTLGRRLRSDAQQVDDSAGKAVLGAESDEQRDPVLPRAGPNRV